VSVHFGGRLAEQFEACGIVGGGLLAGMQQLGLTGALV